MAGLVVFASVALLAIVLAGGWKQYIYDCWVWPFRNYVAVNKVPYAGDLGVYFSHVAQLDGHSRLVARWFLYWLVSVPVVAGGCSAFAIWKGVVDAHYFARGGIDSAPSAHVAVALYTLAAMTPLFVGQTRADVAHITFAGFGCVLGLATPLAFLSAPTSTQYRRAAFAAVLIWATLGALLWIDRCSLSPRFRAIAAADSIVSASSGADVLARFAGPNEPVTRLDVGSGWIHIFGVPSISRYTLLMPPSTGYNTIDQWNEVAERIWTANPRVVLAGGEGLETLSHRPGLRERYRYYPGLAVAQDFLGDSTGQSVWAVDYAESGAHATMQLTHFGRRVIGTLSFPDRVDTVLGIVEDDQVLFLDILPNGHLHAHVCSVGSEPATGKWYDSYGVPGTMEMTRVDFVDD